MMKIKVSREVAKEVEYAKEEFRYELSALKYLFMEAEIENDDDVVLSIKAYLNGYEVEETPEENVLKCYESYGDSPSALERKGGIIETLEALGLKIEGVNA